MDEFEERKLRLLYRQNLTVADVVDARGGCFGEETRFKQQHNSKLQGRFTALCHEMGAGDFRSNPPDGELSSATPEDAATGMEIEVRRGPSKAAAAAVASTTVTLDAAERRRFDADVCFGCQNPYVAGVNMRVRVEYGRRPSKRRGKQQQQGKQQEPRQAPRSVVYECLVCGVCVVFRHALLPAGTGAERRSRRDAHLPLNTLPGQLGDASAVAAAAAPPKPAKKPRRRRKGGLGELLAQKRQQQRRDGDPDGDGDAGSGLRALLT